MKRKVSVLALSVLLAGCAASRASEPSAGYCKGMTQVANVMQGWHGSMTDHQATTTLAKAYLALADAAAYDFGGKTQLDVTAFSDDVGRLKLAIDNGAGIDRALAAVSQAIPRLPACAGSSSP